MLKAAAELAPVLAMAGFRHPAFAYIGVGIKGVEVLHSIYSEIRTTSGTPWDYFELHGTSRNWIFVPGAFHRIVLDRVSSRRLASRSAEDSQPAAWEGEFEGMRVGWIADVNGSNTDSLFIWHEHEDEILERLHELIWAEYSSSHLTVTVSGLEEDALEPGAVIPTNLIDVLTTRIGSFREAGLPRSYMLVGAPGTGKTTCVQHITRTLGLRSLRVPIGELCRSLGIGGDPNTGPVKKAGEGNDALPLGTLVLAARPDIIILDDLDRAPDYVQDELLDFMELARKSVSIIIASVNNPEKLSAALKRPRRIDDHLEVPALELETVKGILGDQADLAEAMADWPVAYLMEFMDRVRVLGPKAARGEVVELERRLQESQVG